MAKETEKRLIRTLEFLKEPHGSTIPTIVKAMNGEGPQVSLKRIVQTLRGCVENGLLKVSDGRVKLRQLDLIEDTKLEEEGQFLDSYGRSKSGCAKPLCPNKPLCTMKTPSKCPTKKSMKLKCSRPCPKGGTMVNANGGEGCGPPNDEGEGEGEGEGGGGGGGEGNKCPPCPKCPRRRKRKRCARRKPRCPRPKRKPKCPRPKKRKRRSKKCPKKNIQPYCRKKKKCA